MHFLDIFIVFARNNLMYIMCKVGDYILGINNIGKTSTQTNTQWNAVAGHQEEIEVNSIDIYNPIFHIL